MKIKEVVEVTPDKMGGMSVFRGTKVPISQLGTSPIKGVVA